MPEKYVGISDQSGHQLTVRSDGLLTTTTIPEGALPFTTLVRNTPGVVAANTFLSVFNPVGSGKTITFSQFVCFPYANAGTTVTDNMEVWRITAASGGTLLATSDINKFDTQEPNSVAQVRTLNPTVTVLGSVPVLAIPPAIGTGGAGVGATINIIPASGTIFVCHEGQGLAARTPVGALGQSWSLGFSWLEI